ncbi:YhhN-like protein [Aspergillus heterothallicus]
MPVPILPPFPGPQLLLLSLPLLVVSEHKSRFHGGVVLFKMLSSASFLIGPVTILSRSASTEWSPYTLAITIGLVFSLIGDFFLLPSRSEFATPDSAHGSDVPVSFQAGVVAFAAAHIAYIIAFLEITKELHYSTLATTFTATLLLAKWLGVIYPPPHSSPRSNILGLTIPAEMKPLVLIYAVIISTMFAVATSMSGTTPGVSDASGLSQRVVGAAMFVVSDVFVAANAFGSARGALNERSLLRIALGYGLYFWAQMVIAGTVERV